MDPITRRGLLYAGLAGALAATPSGSAGADPLGLPLGVQLWSVKAELDQDFEGTLRRLAAIGYRRVEAAGYHGRTPEAFRTSVRQAGLVCDSTHVPMPDLLKDEDGQVGFARDLGVAWLVCSAPAASGPVRPAHPGEDWMDQMRRAMTADDWRRNADQLNRLGERAHAAGLKLAYHSHSFEFARYGGAVGFDLLQQGTDPARVWTELDVGWVVAGGVDPVPLMHRYAARIRLLHLKDLQHRPQPGAAPDYTTVPVGSGVIDWPPVFAAAARIGVSGCYVEQEAPFVQPVMTSLAQSYRYLHAL